jgi:hypothetical protein
MSKTEKGGKTVGLQKSVWSEERAPWVRLFASPRDLLVIILCDFFGAFKLFPPRSLAGKFEEEGEAICLILRQAGLRTARL